MSRFFMEYSCVAKNKLAKFNAKKKCNQNKLTGQPYGWLHECVRTDSELNKRIHSFQVC